MNALLPAKWNHPIVMFVVDADASYVLKLGACTGESFTFCHAHCGVAGPSGRVV